MYKRYISLSVSAEFVMSQTLTSLISNAEPYIHCGVGCRSIDLQYRSVGVSVELATWHHVRLFYTRRVQAPPPPPPPPCRFSPALGVHVSTARGGRFSTVYTYTHHHAAAGPALGGRVGAARGGAKETE